MNSEERLAAIAGVLEAAPVPFLVMGGHAVRFYGLRRDTADFDLHLSIERWDSLFDVLRQASLFAGQVVDDAVILVELAHQLEATPVVIPGVLLAGVEPERDRGAEGESLILAEVVVRGGMPALDGTGLHGVHHLQSADDLAGREQLDVELASGRLAHALTDQLGAAVQGIQALRPARRHAPVDAGLRLRDCRRGNGAERRARRRLLQE